MKTSEVLTQAKALIETPDTWIQKDYSKTLGDGTQCFCSLGALAKVMWGDLNEVEYNWSAVPAEKLLSKVVGHNSTTFAMYNDDHTHSEVMEAFDKAIDEALKDERKLDLVTGGMHTNF